MPNTVKWGLRYPAGEDAPDIPQDFQDLATDLDSVAMYSEGPIGSRPAPTTSGRLYHAVDDKSSSIAGTTYLADGVVWQPVRSDTAVADTLQEGVISSGDGVVSRTDSNTVAVTAGVGWIDGDGINGFTGRTRITWPATSLTLSNAAASMGRLDQIVVAIPTNGLSVGVATVLTGTAVTPVPTLDNRTNAAVLPAGHLRLADIVVDAFGITGTSSIRDRRPWCKGAFRYVLRTANESGGNAYLTNATYYVNLDPINIYPRMEVQGNNVEITITGVHANYSGTGGTMLKLSPLVDGSVPMAGYAGSYLGTNSASVGEHEMTCTPSPGSHRIGIAYLSTAPGGPGAGWYCDPGNVITVTIREVVGTSTNRSNGT